MVAMIDLIREAVLSDASLVNDIIVIERRRRQHRHAGSFASDDYLRHEMGFSPEGLRLNLFFDRLRIKHGLSQKECPKRYLFTVMREVMERGEVRA